jgi:hypothetical protein
LGGTLICRPDQITAWHKAHVSNGPTEVANDLIKRVRRVAFGFTRIRNYRVLSCPTPAHPPGPTPQHLTLLTSEEPVIPAVRTTPC